MTTKMTELKTDITTEIIGIKERLLSLEKRPATTGGGLLQVPPGLLPSLPPNSNFQQTLQPSSSHAPRMHKLLFPTFDGKEDPLGWLNRCEQFFRCQQTPESDKVWLASYHLVGSAQQWYYQLERDDGEPPWQLFKDYCNLRFGLPIRNNFLGELAKLQAVSTMEDYQEEFLALLCRADSLPASNQVQLFMSGLMEPVRTDVEL
uniref:Retrotransposon gag domain-containing protein n=1 Tax=Phyllostachys edulis TaxID=38705 RepID=Q0PPV6_PHYED|nr:unknown [Phyllostachys edulis]